VVAFLLGGRSPGGRAALPVDDSTLAGRKKPRRLLLAARELRDPVLAALRKVSARARIAPVSHATVLVPRRRHAPSPAVRQVRTPTLAVRTAHARALVARTRHAPSPAGRKEYARPLAVWTAYALALAALYRGAPPPPRAKLLAERRGSAVFAQPPNASSLVTQASPATALVVQSWRAMTRVQLPMFLTNETAIESSGSGPLTNETATESSGSGPLANETATESFGSGPPANETAIESSGSGPPPTLGLQSLRESSFLRVAT
jgi:hypothetical protein